MTDTAKAIEALRLAEDFARIARNCLAGTAQDRCMSTAAAIADWARDFAADLEAAELERHEDCRKHPCSDCRERAEEAAEHRAELWKERNL